MANPVPDPAAVPAHVVAITQMVGEMVEEVRHLKDQAGAMHLQVEGVSARLLPIFAWFDAQERERLAQQAALALVAKARADRIARRTRLLNTLYPTMGSIPVGFLLILPQYLSRLPTLASAGITVLAVAIFGTVWGLTGVRISNTPPPAPPNPPPPQLPPSQGPPSQGP